MNGKHLVVAAISAAFLMFTSCGGPGRGGHPLAGFTQAVFDEDGLNVLLKDPECKRVRFYNAKRNATDTEGMVMAVAVRADGSEYDIMRSKNGFYRVSDKIVGSNVSYTDLDSLSARQACRWAIEAEITVVAADVSAHVLKRMLSINDINGIRVTPATAADGGPTMRFAAAKISGGIAQEQTGAGSSMICGDPCPAYCSEDVEYVHM